MPDFFVGAWTVLLAPVGTPTPIIRKIHDDMRTALDDPEMQDEARRPTAAFVRHMTPEEVTAFVQNEQKTWRPILEQVAQRGAEVSAAT